jgi:hypothetical protein
VWPGETIVSFSAVLFVRHPCVVPVSKSGFWTRFTEREVHWAVSDANDGVANTTRPTTEATAAYHRASRRAFEGRPERVWLGGCLLMHRSGEGPGSSFRPAAASCS